GQAGSACPCSKEPCPRGALVLVAFLEKLHQGICFGGIRVALGQEWFQLLLFSGSMVGCSIVPGYPRVL
ncbi:MAG TPA: hypothetical protein P5560_11070, partial [Thermotogota bacterium]|nr:hypothetical protein [Thermotogota bacterium]